MRVNKDTRGKSYFDIFAAQKGQTDLSYNHPGTIRAFHQHQYKEEYWLCVKGEFKVVLSDPIETIYLSPGELCEIKRGRWHGFQVLGSTEGIMVEHTTAKHDMDNLDDYRKPYDAFDNWEIERK
jgi:dTDP-4-dehydrorhamnose 3,5-epimerase-like enzyme